MLRVRQRSLKRRGWLGFWWVECLCRIWKRLSLLPTSESKTEYCVNMVPQGYFIIIISVVDGRGFQHPSYRRILTRWSWFWLSFLMCIMLQITRVNPKRCYRQKLDSNVKGLIGCEEVRVCRCTRDKVVTIHEPGQLRHCGNERQECAYISIKRSYLTRRCLQTISVTGQRPIQ